MKKTLAVFFSLCIALSLPSCGNKDNADNQVKTGTSSTQESLTPSLPAVSGSQTQKYAYNESIYGCYSEGKKIYGRLFVPETGEEKLPIVIMCHGMYNTHESMEYLANKVAAQGIISYIFDFCGGAPGSKSTGKVTDMSPLTEREDLLTVIDTMKELENVDTSRIYLCGYSQGGYVAAATAALRPDDISGLILIAPAFHIDETARGYSSVDEIPEIINLNSLTMGKCYFADVWDFYIYKEMKKYKKPVIIMHGDADTNVDVSYSKKAVKTFSDAKLTIMPGATHILTDEEFDKVSDAVGTAVLG